MWLNTCFKEFYACFRCETKTRAVRILVKIGLCSAISFGRSRRELFIDVAKHCFKNTKYQNTYDLRFSFTSKTGIELTKTDASFLQCTLHY